MPVLCSRRVFLSLFLIGSLVEAKSVNLFDVQITKLVNNLKEEFTQKVGNYKDHPDYGLDVFQFLDKYGYPYEIHEITTEDGYIVTSVRVPRGRNSSNEILKVENSPPIILQHGMGTMCMDYVNKGPGEALGLILADAGWDVWLGNTRGSRYSRNHTTLDPDVDKEFWEFSWEEAGAYDIAAVIDHIRTTTGHEKVAYVGHSQGTTQFFALTALRPDYNDKIAVMAALAPVAYMEHMSSPLVKLLAYHLDVFAPLLEDLQIYELFRYDRLEAEILSSMCKDGSPVQEFCAFFMFLLCGFNTREMDRSFLQVETYNTPGGISSRMVVHYGQEILSRHFRRFDLGEESNLVKYNSTEPPDYNISAITAPVALYYSLNDLFTSAVDVERFAAQLPNLVKLHLMEDKFFSHIDFVLAKNAATKLYAGLVDFLSGYVTDSKIY